MFGLEALVFVGILVFSCRVHVDIILDLYSQIKYRVRVNPI